MIRVNRVKAESAVRERLRLEREALLIELDMAYMRALEQGQSTGDIVARKQALRDVTGKSLAHLTLEQLSSLTLEDALFIESEAPQESITEA